MDTPHNCTFIEKNFPEVNITDHNAEPKLKVQESFVRKSVVFCPILYLYHGYWVEMT